MRKKKSSTNTESVIAKRTRQSIDLPTHNNECLFCDKSDGKLHEAQNESISTRVKECAINLKDERLLTKLAVTDMHVMHSKYHINCLVDLYNRDRDRRQKAKIDTDASPESVVLQDIIEDIKTKVANGDQTTFKLKDISNYFHEKLEQISPDSPATNISRLKSYLLSAIPSLGEIKSGREIILVHSKLSQYSILSKAALLIRKSLFQTTANESNFATNIPENLLTLIRMILDGTDVAEFSKQRLTAAESICQLIMFNSIKRKRNVSLSEDIRHKIDRENPLTVYTAMKLHVKTRNKEVINRMNELGLCISYGRTLKLSEDLCNNVMDLYEQNGTVCPPTLPKGVFTTTALDNLDHDPKSTVANWTFHGTALSMTCHVDENYHSLEPSFPKSSANLKKSYALLESYSIVPPVSLKNKSPIVPSSESSADMYGSQETFSDNLSEEYQWLEHVKDIITKSNLEPTDVISWAAFHASRIDQPSKPNDISSVLPLFFENAHSTAMVKHGMEMLKKAVDLINPGQVIMTIILFIYLFIHPAMISIHIHKGIHLLNCFFSHPLACIFIYLSIHPSLFYRLL